MAEDHFVKVRGIIKDLIAKLEADAESEADQKSFCDTEMKAAISSRDEAQASIESLTADISQAEAKKAQTEAEIQALTEAITELRAQERAENEKTIADATSGKSAVEFALQVLQEFYEGAVALQLSYVPPNSDREGKTVGDLAPEVFSGRYSGRQDASKGILGMLEVILSDFERTIETVTAEEEAAQADFEAFEADTKADISAKEAEKSEKEAEVAALTDKIAELTDELKDAEEKKKEALAELEKLKPMCVEAEETYAERVAKREAEIEALKQAMEILENWQA